jgi:hypothetical protein
MPHRQVIVKEIPIPTEKTMLIKLLMSLSEKYELEATRISVDYREVRAPFCPSSLNRRVPESYSWSTSGLRKDLFQFPLSTSFNGMTRS